MQQTFQWASRGHVGRAQGAESSQSAPFEEHQPEQTEADPLFENRVPFVWKCIEKFFAPLVSENSKVIATSRLSKSSKG
eukprot:5617442-Amphidinium_carterae.1